MDYKFTDEFIYKGYVVEIEESYSDGTYKISNPEWDWDQEGECVSLGIDYDVPYWIVVKGSEITKKVKENY